jgi:formylglycine-generating enzyme required for sulfatase activity
MFVSVLSFSVSIASQEAIGEEKALQKKKLTNSLGMKFVLIPAGTFTMGSPSSEKGRQSEEKQHEVTLTSRFYMQVTEVTQGQWQTIVGNNPSFFPNCGDNCPVEQVSFNDCKEFIRRLNQKEGTNKYRLPTEAEWEYACRAGSTTAFANGGITKLECGYDPNLDAMGWYCANSGKKTHPVARKNPNAWGLYDMQGNVWEWCQDLYGDYPTGQVTDPKGPSSGRYRVMRGGDWRLYTRHCRSAHRRAGTPGYSRRIGNVGFRLARDF